MRNFFKNIQAHFLLTASSLSCQILNKFLKEQALRFSNSRPNKWLVYEF